MGLLAFCRSAVKVAVTGGRGFLGSHFVRACRAKGHTTTSILAHDSMPAGEDEAAIGLDSSVLLSEALVGCEAVVHCAGISYERPGRSFRGVHVDGTRNLLAAARQANVKKVILTSFLRARPHCGSSYHESKWEAEQLVRQSGLNYTILKLGLLYGRGDQLTTQLERLLKSFPVFGNIGWSDPMVRPVAVDDAVSVLLHCLTEPKLKNMTVPVLGAETLRLSGMVRKIGARAGVDPVIVPLPVIFHRVLAWIGERVLNPPLVTVAQVRMLEEGLVEASPPFEKMPEEFSPQSGFLESASQPHL